MPPCGRLRRQVREDVQELYELAFARHDHAKAKRREFAECWADYISVRPWDIDVRNVDQRTLVILAVMREPGPAELALIFSEWLALPVSPRHLAASTTATARDPRPLA